MADAHRLVKGFIASPIYTFRPAKVTVYVKGLEKMGGKQHVDGIRRLLEVVTCGRHGSDMMEWVEIDVFGRVTDALTADASGKCHGFGKAAGVWLHRGFR